MPRRTGMRDDDVLGRLHDAERRLDVLEALPEAVASADAAKQARADARAAKKEEAEAAETPATDTPLMNPFAAPAKVDAKPPVKAKE
jgi:hypothetical protein